MQYLQIQIVVHGLFFLQSAGQNMSADPEMLLHLAEEVMGLASVGRELQDLELPDRGGS